MQRMEDPVSKSQKIVPLACVALAVLVTNFLLMADRTFAWVPDSSDVADRDSNGVDGNNISWIPSISTNGRYVTFLSESTNLVTPNTLPGQEHAYRKDMVTGQLEILDIDSNGNVPADAMLLEREPVKLSGDGSKALFNTSSALIPEDTNDRADLYIRDVNLGTTTRVSLGGNGQQANESTGRGYLSNSGDFVVFASIATNLVPGITTQGWRYYVRDLVNNTTVLLNLPGQGEKFFQDMSNDGRYFIYNDCYLFENPPGSTQTLCDAFVLDRNNDTITQVNVLPAGAPSVMSANDPRISGDGRYVTFASADDGLDPNDQHESLDVFVRDMVLGVTKIVSITSTGQPANSNSSNPDISDDGRYIVFPSTATNLAPQPQQINTRGIYVRDTLTNRTERANPETMNDPIMSGGQTISGDGQYVAMATTHSPFPSNNWTVLRRDIGSIFPLSQFNTPAGNDIQFTQPPLSLIYSQITIPGDTTVTSSSSGTTPPSGFKLGNPPTYYSITTTAIFSGNVQICFTYDEGTINGPETNLRLMHFAEGSGWQDVTVSVDTNLNVVCGLTDSFSDFALTTLPTIQDLIKRVSALNLQQGIQNSLDAKLQNAQTAFEARTNGNTTQALNALGAFKHEVEAQRGVKLTNSQADELTNWATNLTTIIEDNLVFGAVYF